jgi:transposase
MDGTDFLPNDLRECQRLLLAAFQQATQLERRVVESEQQVAELNRVLSETATSYESLQQEHAATLDELAWYKRWAYGRRRERFAEDQGQSHLFDLDPGLLADIDLPEPTSADDAIDVHGHRRRRKKREIDWDKLPQIRHEHDLPEAEKTCSCCGRRMDCIGEDVTRELELQPAKLEAHIHVRPKYACRYCKAGVCAGPLPQRPIPGGIAGPGLVSDVIVSKFGDHLPLYRLEDIFTRYGVYIPRSTLCDWVQCAAELFRPLYEIERRRVLQSTVMWTDDTPNGT